MNQPGRDSSFTLALIGGTGLNELSPEHEIISIDTPFGPPSSGIRVIETDPVRVLFLPRHGSPHRIPPHKVNYRANIRALRDCGADSILAVYAVGGITPGYSPGTLALADQLIDYTWGRQHTYSDSENVPLVHVDFTRPYDGPLRRAVLEAAGDTSIQVIDGGCIGVFQGPRLESAAEVERARRDGCDMAGMTSLPEAALARELGLDYAGLAVVSNYGAGVSDELLSEDDIAATLKEPMIRVRSLINRLITRLDAA
jgi:5'-methylthioinosine phosphorylase